MKKRDTRNSPKTPTDKINILSIDFDCLSLEGAAEKIISLAKEKKGGYAVTPNSTIAHSAQKDLKLLGAISNSALTLPDGVGITLAAKIYKTPFRFGRVAGVELGEAVAELAAGQGLSVFFLGGTDGVAERAAERLSQKYKGLSAVGCEDGYFPSEDEIIAKIKKSSADILYCCLGSPKQELFAQKLSKEIPELVILCLGGSLDVYSGKTRRAPKLFINLGCEWLFRILASPKKITRLPSLFAFLFDVLRTKPQKTT